MTGAGKTSFGGGSKQFMVLEGGGRNHKGRTRSSRENRFLDHPSQLKRNIVGGSEKALESLD